MVKRMIIDYDKRFDTLYLAFDDKSNSYGDDSQDDVIVMKDIDTDAVTGITVLSFLRKYQLNALPKLLETFGFSIEKDILPEIGYCG